MTKWHCHRVSCARFGGASGALVERVRGARAGRERARETRADRRDGVPPARRGSVSDRGAFARQPALARGAPHRWAAAPRHAEPAVPRDGIRGDRADAPRLRRERRRVGRGLRPVRESRLLRGGSRDGARRARGGGCDPPRALGRYEACRASRAIRRRIRLGGGVRDAVRRPGRRDQLRRRARLARSGEGVRRIAAGGSDGALRLEACACRRCGSTA